MAQTHFSSKILYLVWRWGKTGERFLVSTLEGLWSLYQPLPWRKVLVLWPVSRTLNFHHDCLWSIHKIIVTALLVFLGFLTHYNLIRLSLWYRLLNPELQWNTCLTSADTSMWRQAGLEPIRLQHTPDFVFRQYGSSEKIDKIKVLG